jgi:hypothetical protein
MRCYVMIVMCLPVGCLHPLACTSFSNNTTKHMVCMNVFLSLFGLRTKKPKPGDNRSYPIMSLQYRHAARVLTLVG